MRNPPGGGVIWIFAVVELVTFGLFFGAYAVYAAREPEVFAASQAHVHAHLGAVNTAVLLVASWGAARAVGRRVWWWLVPVVAGVVFVGIKSTEYAHVFALGVSLSTNAFWFFYLFLTLFHALHVVAGVVIGAVMLGHHLRGAALRGEVEEAAGIYWHVVDLIWIALFPLLYLVHPGGPG